MAHRRAPNPRLAKLHCSYTVEEAARALDTHKNTIRTWLKAGLASVAGSWPVLIRGADLRDFLSRRRASAKRPCPPGHLYCLRCREPRKPDAALVEYLPAQAGAGNIRAVCPCCTTLMHRRASAPAFEAFRWSLRGNGPQAESHIGDRR
ncbi:MAG: helix-turn-helix domain-containing protein [Reyranellaceae bacterium]